MDITPIDQAHCFDLIAIFKELETYYFGELRTTEAELEGYLTECVFSDHSGINVVAAYENSVVIGFATYSILYPAPKQSGQMYMKELFVSSSARGKGVGLRLIKYLARLAVDHHCQRLDWTAERSNPNAGAFYRSIGAHLVSDKEYYRFEGESLNKIADAE